MPSSAQKLRPPAMPFPRVFSQSRLIVALAYLCGYVLLDWISFIQPYAHFGITPWNPSTGLSFVVVLLFGQRFIPLLFVAPLLADLLVRQLPLPYSLEIATSLIIGGGYSAGLLVLLRPSLQFHPGLTSMRDLLLLIGVAAASGAAVAAGYVGALAAAGVLPAKDFAAAALQYWIGDIIGVAVVSPVALILLTRRRALQFSSESLLQLLAILAALALFFVTAERHRFDLFYLLFLPVIWTAVRGGLEMVSVGILVTQLGLLLCIQLLPRAEIDVVAFQALMLVLALSGLAAGAIVTEHRRTELQLRRHQESLARVARLGSMGEFAAMIAHEINQPLMAAGTYTRLVAACLHGAGPVDAAAVESAEKAAAQVERAAEVVRRLRALIRLDQSGRAPITMERIVADTLNLCRPDLERHGIAVRIDLAPDLPPVMADLLQIEQVMLNLLRNAAEAMQAADHAEGSIAISAQREGMDWVRIAVSDTGPGLLPEQGNAGLQPLTSNKPEGLGIGLSLCRSIVEAHSGEFAIGPGAPGGVVVRFTLPAAKTD